MPTPTMNDRVLRDAAAAVIEHGSVSAAARVLGVPRQTLQGHWSRARASNVVVSVDGLWSLAREEWAREAELPDELRPVEEILADRLKRFERKSAAEEARKLIDISVKLDGPIGILHFGDPHVDDDGCDLPLLCRHLDLVQQTPGLFGATVGDLQNNWVGRLSHLWSQQSTTAQEAWRLVEWLVARMRPLYLIGGNHDAWSGNGDPLQWIMRQAPGVHQNDGVRLNLKFPNGRAVTINARHDFPGHSQWNPTHGISKAAQMGWRDDILIAGHKHVFGYHPTKDPLTGKWSHAIRVGSYKVHDAYAKQNHFPDHNLPAVVTVIDPDARREEDLVSVHMSVERGASYLTWLRQR